MCHAKALYCGWGGVGGGTLFFKCIITLLFIVWFFFLCDHTGGTAQTTPLGLGESEQ